jgi:hypothetical protein
LRWKRGEFAITQTLLPRALFEQWILEEGKIALRDALRNTRQRWFFGDFRARRKIYRAARTAFRRNGTFSEALRKRASRLPTVVRSCGIAIRKLGYANLCTYDSEKVLAVVPRAIVQNDFRVHLLRELTELPQVKEFKGLPERVIASAAIEAEAVLFDHLERRAPLVDESGRGLVMKVERDFPWKLGSVDGHYYYAYSLDEKIDLKLRKDRKRFLTAMGEVLTGTQVHLKRLPPDELADLRSAINVRRMASGAPIRDHSALARARVRIETEEATFSETV